MCPLIDTPHSGRDLRRAFLVNVFKEARFVPGIEQGEVLIGGDDIYGHGVNLASRLSQLAGPDEIVVSASIRDHLTPAVDADIEDLGECFLKHVRTPVRAYRIRPAGLLPMVPSFVLDDHTILRESGATRPELYR